MRDIEKRIARAEPKMPAGRALITDQKSIQRMVDFVAGYNDVADHIRCQLSDHDRDAVVVPVRNVDLPNLRVDWFRRHTRPVLGSADIEILQNPAWSKNWNSGRTLSS
jgi:hypothetical protein